MAKAPTNTFFKPTAWLLEGVALLLATPFLLFPTVSLPLTAIIALLFLILTTASILHFKTAVLKPSPLTIPIILITLGAIVGTLVSTDRDLTLPKISGIILGLLWYRYLTIHSDVQKTSLLIIALGFGFALMGFVTADWSLIKIPGLSPLLARIIPSQATAINRGAGVHLNQIGGTILLFAPLVWSLTLFLRNRWLVLLSIASLALLAITQSRSGWVGMGAVLITLIVLQAIRQNSSPDTQIKTVLGTLTTIFAISIVALSMGILSRFSGVDTAVGSLDSLGFREELWHWARKAIADYPVTGTGLGTFRRVAPRLYPLSFPDTYDIAHAHNQFFQVWLDTGIVGIIGYVGVLITSLQIAFRKWTSADMHAEMRPFLRPFILGAILTLFGFHMFGLTDALSLGAKPGLLFWLLLAMIHNLDAHSAPAS